MERIGHYKIVSELGRGGMGVVYKAHEESLNRFVAIKLLGEHLESDDEYVERFVREAQSAARLSHPNIVQIYAIAEEGGHHYFVMEYVQGTSVQRMIQTRGKIPPAEAARLILQAASGLQDAHAQGVIHRDIKPANLMVTDRGLVKIADFGLALMGSATTRLTATGMLMGTPGYLSPEQCLDQGADHRTDIYSLGVTFFEMVTGTMPFKADSPLALLKQIVEVDAPDVRDLNPDVDEDLRSIIAGMLAKDREQRTSSCTEVINAVQGWLTSHGEPLQSPTEGVAAGTAAGVVPPPPTAMTEDEINTQPTVAVPSGATSDPLPPPPAPAATRPADGPVPAGPGPTVPAPVATAPATQPRPAPERSHTGLLVAAVVVFILAAGAVAAVLTLKSGILDPLLGRDGERVAAVEDSAEEQSEDATSPAEEPDAGAAAEAAVTAGSRDSTDGDVEVGGSAAPVEAADDGVDSGSEQRTSTTAGGAAGGSTSAAGGAASSPVSGKAASTTVSSGSAAGTSADAHAEPKIQVAEPTATVVLAVGDRFFAAEAESYVKTRLERAGVELIEVTAIPGLEGFVNTESRPAPEKVRAALRPYARYFVPLRVDYLGSREIFYMGQRDLVHQSRVSMAAVDLATGQPLGRPVSFKVEYTQLNADEAIADKLRRVTTGLLAVLPRN